MTAKLELRNVTKTFGTHTVAVDHVSLTLQAGEFFSLLGPSGCGKSTLLRLIAGLETLTSGEILLDGQDIGAIPPHQRPVNMVFQSYGLFPHLTVADNIAYGLKVKGRPSQEIAASVKEIMALVRLDGLARRRPKELSGGQQQRVALARALINYPALLLLDEPLGALDQKLREEMELELVNLQRQLRMTFLFVTHDQREAMMVSDRMAVMRNGNIEDLGPPHAMYETPATRFVADFIGKSNLLPGAYQQQRNGWRGIATAHGMIWSASDAELTPGEMVTVLVRPEKIRLTRAPEAEPNLLRGHIHDIVYEGMTTRYLVRLASNDETMQVFAPNQTRQAETDFNIAEAVYVSFAPQNTAVIREA